MGKAYYNECDPYAAAWLGNLIAAREIPAGDVDTRDIRDVRPADLDGYTQCHFFAGIGVWALALRTSGWDDARPVWTGSCPCQPFSAAGAGLGLSDPRHLWPDWHWLIQQCRPETVFGEQVASSDGLAWIDIVSADLEASGYAIGAVDTCAAGFRSFHIRQRLYFAAEREGLAPNGLEHPARSGWPKRKPEPIGGQSAQRREPRGMVHGIGVGLERQPRNGAGRDQSRRDTPRAQRPAAPSGGSGRMGNPNNQDRRTHGPGTGHAAGETRERVKVSGEPDRSGAPVRLAVATDLGCDGGTGFCGCDAQGGRRDQLANGDGNDGLANSHGDRSAEHEREQRSGSRGCARASDTSIAALDCPDLRADPADGYWRDADWLFCRDGVWRPVGPGTFPLAHAAPARVGRLRAYGNALDAAQATGFVRAYLERNMGPEPVAGDLFEWGAQ